MSISRRDLYAAGEPLGDSVTRAKLGGGYVCGFGGSSKSSNASTTQNYDNRVAVQGGVGLANSNGNAVTINTMDGGIVARALDSIDTNNATNAEGFTKLLDAAESLWQRGENLIGQTQKHVADAYSQAQTDKAGTIDNRTLIVLGVAGAAALAFMNRKG